MKLFFSYGRHPCIWDRSDFNVIFQVWTFLLHQWPCWPGRGMLSPRAASLFSNHPLYVKNSAVSPMFLRMCTGCDSELIDRELDFFKRFRSLFYLKLAAPHSYAEWKFYDHSPDTTGECQQCINHSVQPVSRWKTPCLNEPILTLFFFTYPLRNTLIKHNPASSALTLLQVFTYLHYSVFGLPEFTWAK